MPFREDDVLFNIHGYTRFDKGLIEGSLTKLINDFPGEVFGVAEQGYSEDLYGFEQIPSENVFFSKPYSGVFDLENEIEDPNSVVVAGGELSSCLNESYNILQEEMNDCSFILPTKSCYGYHSSSNPEEYLLFTLDEVLNGDYDTVSTDLSELTKPLKSFNWNNTCMRSI